MSRSVKDERWWKAVLEEVEHRPVDEVARRYGVEPEVLDRGLCEASHGGAVEEEPWWPEVMRLHRTRSLRGLARRFDTQPRRLRRGLARLGIRVGGQDVSDEGVPELREFQDELGRVPDREIADLAGVSPEAVKGERNRLGIPPYRFRRNEDDETSFDHEPTDDSDTEPGADPEDPDRQSLTPRRPLRRRRRFSELPQPEVIRRPAPETVAPRTGRDDPAGPEVPDSKPPSPPKSLPLPPLTSSGDVQEDERSVSGRTRSLGLDLPTVSSSEGLAESRQGRLRDRPGRTRIVRPSPDRGRSRSRTSRAAARRVRPSRKAPVKVVRFEAARGTGSVDDTTGGRASPEHAPVDSDLPPEADEVLGTEAAPPERDRPAPPPPPSVKPSPSPAPAAATEPSPEPSPAAEPERAPEPAPEPDRKPAPEPALEPPAPEPAPEPVPAVASRPEPAPATVPEPPPEPPSPAVAAPEPERVPETRKPSHAWQVGLSTGEILLVVAPDLPGALRAASRQVGRKALARASAWKLCTALTGSGPEGAGPRQGGARP